MHDQGTQAKTVETLRGLLERLGSPQITLSEASILRCQVAQFLGQGACAACCDDRASRVDFGATR